MLNSTELNERYEVIGIFKELSVGGRLIRTRPEAFICKKGIAYRDMADQKADAVMIMLNPGSCSPVSEELFDGWKKAKPDSTQYQLMRLMEEQRWEKLTILNLSDLCEGNSKEFEVLVKTCEREGVAHSRFLANPSEWKKIISSANVLLYGWGASPNARRMANSYGLLDVENILVSYGKQPIAAWDKTKKYPRHPFPRILVKCEEWLSDMVASINTVETNKI